MTPIVYLHVGPHKTGSTYLQDVFARQAKSLEQQGILYPAAGREYSFGHHNIAWYFNERPLIKTNPATLAQDLSRLADETKGNLLLSSEEFSRVPANQLAGLRRAFPNRAFHVLYFRRKGSALVVSLWLESVKNGLMLSSLDEVTHTDLSGNLRYDPFDHHANIARFGQSLEGTVSVFDYNELLASGVDITRPVSETIQAELKSNNRSINASYEISVIELMRAANIYNAGIGKRRRGFPRIACHRMLKIPILNAVLRHNIRIKFGALRKSLSAKRFLEMGFQSSHFMDGDGSAVYDYIPGTDLLNELNKDDILPWRIIKKWIREN